MRLLTMTMVSFSLHWTYAAAPTPLLLMCLMCKTYSGGPEAAQCHLLLINAVMLAALVIVLDLVQARHSAAIVSNSSKPLQFAAARVRQELTCSIEYILKAIAKTTLLASLTQYY